MPTNFRTIIDVKQYPVQIDYSTPILMLGSCFAENIGEMLRERKFPILINPNGVVYNPVSVALVLQRIIENKVFTEEDLLYHNNLWLSLHHHTSFSKLEKQDTLNAINNSLKQANTFCEKMDYLMVTFGTARVYYYKATGMPVANCHKIPAKEFTHKILTVDEIVHQWDALLKILFDTKPQLKVFFTVSPVRHWKDGAVGNQISKATLLVAVNKLVEAFPNQVFYFPSYEIMIDDLRDYRFYADDMLHPSPLAIKYIWQKFQSVLISNELEKTIAEIESIIQACNHRPFNTNTKEYKLFVEKIRKRIEEIQNCIEGVDFTEELLSLPTNM